jgi:hypothetical protein
LILCLRAVLVSLLLSMPTAVVAGPRVVIVSEQPTSGTVRRLQAELSALGWTPTATHLGEPRPDVIGLHAILNNHKASAAVALLSGDDGATDVWILDEVGMVVSRERFDSRAAQDVLVLRTVERLRASRIAGSIKPAQRTAARQASRPTQPKPPPGPPPAQRHDVELPAAAPERAEAGVSRALHVSGGLGVGWSPGGFSATSHARLGVSWALLDWLAADVTLLAPFVPARASSETAEADIYPAMAALGLRAQGGSSRSWVRPSLAAGIGGLLVHIRGNETINKELVRHEQTVGMAAALVEGAGAFRLTRTLRLKVACLLGANFHRLVPRYLNGRTMNHLLVSGSVGLELEVP